MKKLFLLFFFILAIQICNAQFLNLGIGGGGSKINLEINNDGSYGKWYYPNMENEIIVLKNITPDKSLKISGSLHATYIAKQNYMVRTDMQLFYNESNVEYSNSVDTVTYFSAFKSISGHESMKFRYWFLSNTMDVGYIFLPTKTLRPYVYAGAGMLTCLNIAVVGDYVDSMRSNRNSFIRREALTFKRFSPKANIGVGVRYHTISAEAYYSTNFGRIDIWKKDENPTYDSYSTYGFTVRLDLFTLNLSSKATKNKVKELGKF